MSIVTYNGKIPARGNYLTSALYAGVFLHSTDNIVKRDAKLHAYRNRTGNVRDVEKSRYHYPDKVRFLPLAEPEARTCRFQLNTVRVIVGILLYAETKLAALSLVKKTFAVIIVNVYQCSIALAEKKLLCLIVVLHVLMVIEVILSEICECSDFKMG